jgi:mannitol/fructose-specific phosphotransferase system IIA component
MLSRKKIAANRQSNKIAIPHPMRRNSLLILSIAFQFGISDFNIG